MVLALQMFQLHYSVQVHEPIENHGCLVQKLCRVRQGRMEQDTAYSHDGLREKHDSKTTLQSLLNGVDVAHDRDKKNKKTRKAIVQFGNILRIHTIAFAPVDSRRNRFPIARVFLYHGQVDHEVRVESKSVV